MSVMDINEAAIMVLREHLGTGVYDDHFFENVEEILSIFNGEETFFVDNGGKRIYCEKLSRRNIIVE